MQPTTHTRLTAAAVFFLALWCSLSPAVKAASEVDTSEPPPPIPPVAAALICTCRCCYQGGCNTMANVSWAVNSCSECTTKSCTDYIVSSEVRAETARLFEGIQGESIWATGEDVRIDECQVISVLEAATCVSKTCKRTTTIKAECYNRDAPLIKFSIVSFVLITLVAVVFGVVKNNIPAFQAFNEKYFNY